MSLFVLISLLSGMSLAFFGFFRCFFKEFTEVFFQIFMFAYIFFPGIHGSIHIHTTGTEHQ